MVRGELENMGKRKITTTPETSEALGEVVVTEQPAPPAEETVIKELITSDVPTVCQPANIFSDAPEIYGVNPTVQEIEEFRTAYLNWKRKHS